MEKRAIPPLDQCIVPGRDVDILLAMHSAQKSESLQHRQNFFNAFAAWATILLAIIGALATFAPAAGWTIWLILSVVTGLTGLVIYFMWRQRTLSAEALNIAKGIERRLGIYEEGRYMPAGVLLFPKALGRPAPKHFTLSDWLQVAVLVVLMALMWVVIAFRGGPSTP